MVHVIDTSVAVKWFVLEKGSQTALEIFSQLTQAPHQFVVPELFFFELIHVLYRVLKQPSVEQKKILKYLLHSGIHRFSFSLDSIEEILHFQTLGLSGYDAAYVTLAKTLHGKWLTFDGKAHKKVAHLGISELLI